MRLGDSGDEWRYGSGGLAGSVARASDCCSVSGVGAVTVFFPGDSSLRMLDASGKSTD
jgi:hypothetical protein